jgi:hypothetical protein
MCFSTTASFASGTILTVIGVISVKKIEHKSQILFASIPFIFAIQQFAEGFVWLSLLHSSNHLWQQIATYSFLLFALVIWPAWVPISMFLVEKKHNRKIILGIFSCLGLLFSVLSSIYLILYTSEAQITSYHIHYELNIPFGAKVSIGILYLIPTVMSNFISSTKGVPLMGVFVLLSYLVSKLFFDDYVISVWCFFSALISMTIYFILSKEKALVIKSTHCLFI